MGKRNEYKGIKFKHLKFLMPIDWLLQRFGYKLYGIPDVTKLKSGQGMQDNFTVYIITIEKK